MKQIWTNSKLNGEADRHEYDLIEQDGKIKLLYSDHSEWMEPGEERARVEDNGNEIIVNIDGQVIKLDYQEAFEMLVLLIAVNKDQLEVKETTTIFTL